MGHFGGRTHCGRLRLECGSGAAPSTQAADWPSHDEIACLAHSYWEAGGRREGLALADWLRAERELSRRRGLE